MPAPRPRAELLRRWLSRLVALVLLLSGLLAPPAALAGEAASAASPGAAASAASRPDAEATAEPLAPHDQPRIDGRRLELPRVPESFNTYEGGWVRFAYSPSVRQRVQALIGEADAFRDRLAAQLGQRVLGEVHVFVARTPGEMATFAPEGAPFPDYAAGVAYPSIGLVLLTISPVYASAHHDLAEVFRHELAHVALHDAVLGAHVPRWFNEGYAVNASGERAVDRLQAVWTATVAGTLIPLDRLDRSFPGDPAGVSLAYAQSAEVVRFLSRQQDAERFASTVARVRAGEPFPSAVRDAYGVDLGSLEHDWRQDAAKRYTFWPVFFSGSVIWFGALGLFVWGWKRRRDRAKVTLARWEVEEAAEEARVARSRAVSAVHARADGGPTRVHIVFPRGMEAGEPPLPPEAAVLPPPESAVPKVEYEGDWHTLH